MCKPLFVARQPKSEVFEGDDEMDEFATSVPRSFSLAVDAEEEAKIEMVPNLLSETFKKRTELPAVRDPNNNPGMASIVKNPILINEPISMLQKVAEAHEYFELLNQADKEPNSLRRLALIAAFSISQFSGAAYRKGKPFNPLLGETYELITEDFNFISEQVSHHPAISAGYCKAKHFTTWSS